MGAQPLKKSLHQLIDKIDDEDLLKAYLKVIKSSVDEQVKEDTVGYTTRGEALTKQKLKEKVKVASREAKKGNYISHRDLAKESSKW